MITRLRRGRRGGRPPAFDPEKYKQRNVVERRLDAARAVEIGALHGLAADPLAEATAWARHVSTMDSAALAAHKASINRTVGQRR